MDDKKLGRFFRNRLENHEDAGAFEGGWEKLADKLVEVHVSRPWYFRLSDWIGTRAYVLLWLLMLLLIPWMIHQQLRIETLSDALVQQSGAQLIVRTDTVYIERTVERRPSPASAAWAVRSGAVIPVVSFAFPVAAAFPASSPTQTEATGLRGAVSADTAHEPIGDSSGMTDRVPVFSPKKDTPQPNTYTGKMPEIAESEPPIVDKLLITSHQDKKEAANTLDEMIKPPGEKPKKQQRPPFAWQHRLGVQVMVPFVRHPLAPPRVGAGVGLFSEFQLRARIGLSSGFAYHNQRYLIQNRAGSRLSEAERATFPGLVAIGNADQLEEVEVHTEILEVPLSVKYYFPFVKSIRPFAELGVTAQRAFHQEFTYDYGGQPGVAYSAEFSGGVWLMGSYLVSGGMEFPLSDRFVAQTNLVFQHNYRPLGKEQSGYRYLGWAGSLWFQTKK